MSIEVIDLVDMGTQKSAARTFSIRRVFMPGCTTTSRGRKTPCIATTLTRLLSSSKENAR